MKCFRPVFFLMLSVSLIAACGCGANRGLPDGVVSGTVSGIITSDGEMLPEGCRISFLPTGGTMLPASGVVGSDGLFELTARDETSIPTGLYKVVVQPPPLPALTEEEETQEMIEGTTRTNQIDQIPSKYMSNATTTATFEVVAGSNDVVIELSE